jgi:hypothetical protein
MLEPLRRRLFLVSLAACACHTWSPIALSPSDSAVLPAHIRIVRMGGERIEVRTGRVTPDSVVGTRRPGGSLALSRDSVASVEERHLNTGRTLTASALAGGLIVFLGWGVLSIRD